MRRTRAIPAFFPDAACRTSTTLTSSSEINEVVGQTYLAAPRPGNRRHTPDTNAIESFLILGCRTTTEVPSGRVRRMGLARSTSINCLGSIGLVPLECVRLLRLPRRGLTISKSGVCRSALSTLRFANMTALDLGGFNRTSIDILIDSRPREIADANPGHVSRPVFRLDGC